MARKLVVLRLAALTVILCWISWIGRNHRADLALAQDTGKRAERRTILLDRKPVRRWVIEDPYSNFNGVALDEERGELFISNDSSVTGESIEAYRVEFAPTNSTSMRREMWPPFASSGELRRD